MKVFQVKDCTRDLARAEIELLLQLRIIKLVDETYVFADGYEPSLLTYYLYPWAVSVSRPRQMPMLDRFANSLSDAVQAVCDGLTQANLSADPPGSVVVDPLYSMVLRNHGHNVFAVTAPRGVLLDMLDLLKQGPLAEALCRRSYARVEQQLA